MTRDLGWETTYQPRDAVFPMARSEGIVIRDEAAFTDPLHLTVDAYWRNQAEKDRRLYALLDAFAQTSGQLGVSDVRYVNALKLLLQAFGPLHVVAHRGFAHLARQAGNPALSAGALAVAADELRGAQTLTHAASLFNKYFHGLHAVPQWFDQAWHLEAAKSFVDDALASGPYEMLVASCVVFDGLFKPLFVPFLSGAAHNGDLATATAGFSTQADASRHAAWGLAALRMLLEQDKTNVATVQRWIDKWFWRAFRVVTPLAAMQDYMLPKRKTSWRDSWQAVIEGHGQALFAELAQHGIRKPAGWQDACDAKDHLGHQTWLAFYGWAERNPFHTWVPGTREMNWLARRYPDTFERWYRPRLEHCAQRAADGQRFVNRAQPLTCATCRWPLFFTEPGNPRWIAYRESSFEGQPFHFCSDGCRTIFDAEPQRHARQAPPAGLDEDPVAMLERCGIVNGRDNGDIAGSEDARHFAEWGAGQNPREGQL